MSLTLRKLVAKSRFVAAQVQSQSLAARRPLYSALGSERALLLPSLDDALVCYLQECEVEWAEQTA